MAGPTTTIVAAITGLGVAAAAIFGPELIPKAPARIVCTDAIIIPLENNAARVHLSCTQSGVPVQMSIPEIPPY